MFAAVSCQIGHVTVEVLEKETGKIGVEAFDAHINDFVEKVIGSDKDFPPLIFYFEPLRNRATNMVIMDMPQGAPAGQVIDTMTRKYIAEERQYIEKVVIITANLMFKLSLPSEIRDKLNSSGVMPSQAPDQFVDHGLIIVSQQQDEPEADHDLRVLTDAGYVDIATQTTFDLNEGETQSRFENLFDQAKLDELDREAHFMKMKMDPDADESKIIDQVDNMVKSIFNRKFN